ncbi:hypothetical protein ACHQM5_003479 [Ranunculus cassubicifolius]
MELIPGLPNDIGRQCLTCLPYSNFPKFFEVSKRWKMEIESDHFHRQRKCSSSSQALVLLTQSNPDFKLVIYEPESSSWNTIPTIPGYPDGLPPFSQCVGVGRKLVVIGSWEPTTWKSTNSVYVFDFMSGKWKRRADMPGPARLFFGCASDGNRMVFVAGGHDDDNIALSSAMAYDVIKDEWIALPDMPKHLDECKAIFNRSQFHVIGGYRRDDTEKLEMHVVKYDTITGKWCQMDDDLLHKGMCSRNCVADKEGRLFRCSAGCVAVFDGFKWADITKLPVDGKIFVIGSDKFGGIQSIYMCEFSRGKCSAWTKMDAPQAFTGKVQARCWLEM